MKYCKTCNCDTKHLFGDCVTCDANKDAALQVEKLTAAKNQLEKEIIDYYKSCDFGGHELTAISRKFKISINRVKGIIGKL